MREKGTTLLELLLAAGVIGMLAGIALPRLRAAEAAWRTASAARYIASEAMRARVLATTYGAAVGLRFTQDVNGYSWTTYVDGDGDGIRGVDTATGVDRVLKPRQRLSDTFAGVRFALAPRVPPVAGASGDSRAVRLGAGQTLTFGPLGTATSGTLYVDGGPGYQYAIRVLGVTGRVRVLRYDGHLQKWVSW